MLMALYPHHPEHEHTPVVDAFLNRQQHESLLPEAVFVCERENGHLVGFLELSVRNYADGCTGPTPFVESWYVDAEVQGQGIGRKLMAAAEEWARSKGYRELASDAEFENVVSHAAHRAIGFDEVERIVQFRKVLR